MNISIAEDQKIWRDLLPRGLVGEKNRQVIPTAVNPFVQYGDYR